jgi:molybdate transport system ATP-binding protein
VSDHGPSDPGRIRATLRATRAAFRLEVDLDIPAKGLTGIFGPSGGGKTTCLRMLAGLERGQGAVSVGSEVWQDDDRGVFLPPHRRAVGFVFQDAVLFPHLTVRGNLDYALRRRQGRQDGTASTGRGRNVAGEVDAIVERFDLGPMLDRRPVHLSGGERQRVAIARALLAAPRLLLMDEPVASLDAARKREIFPYLERLRDGETVPVVYVSHSLEEISRLASHLVLLESGKVTATGTVAETLARLDLPLAQLEDAAVVIHGRVAAHDETDQLTRIEFAGGHLWIGMTPRPVGAPMRVRVLARDVTLARDPPGPSSILNVLDAHVDELHDAGPGRVNVRLSVGAASVPLLARVTQRSRDVLQLAPGLRLYALIKSVALWA